MMMAVGTEHETAHPILSAPGFALYALCLCILSFAIGCGATWHGRVVHLEDGKVVIQPGGDVRTESGRKLLIYRRETIAHPISGEPLGVITDNIAKVPVLRIRDRTITASAAEPEFGMIAVGDRATAVRGSVPTVIGSVSIVGRIGTVDAESHRAEYHLVADQEVNADGDILTVVKYTATVMGPDARVLAVAVEPVADLLPIETSADGRLWTSYELTDKRLGWIETDDVVVKRTGSMLAETLWFQDPPGGFSKAWIFGRSYLHAIRHYDSGRYREAILDLEDVTETDPEYAEAAYLLGLCHANLNRYDEAAARFEDLLEHRPNDARTWTALAYAYLKQGKHQEAVESYEKLAHLLPGDSAVWTDIGNIYCTLGNEQKAEQAFRKALDIDRRNENAAYELRSQIPPP